MRKSHTIQVARKWLHRLRRTRHQRFVMWVVLRWPFKKPWRIYYNKEFLDHSFDTADLSWREEDLPDLDRVVYSRVYELDGLEKLHKGLKKLNKKYPKKYNYWNLDFIDDFQYRVATMREGGSWEIPIGWVGFSNSSLSKHFDCAWLSLKVMSPRLVCVLVDTRPSGRLRYEYKRALKLKCKDYVLFDKTPWVRLGRIKMSKVPQSTHRWIMFQQSVLQANIDLSEMLNRTLGESGGVGGLWNSFEVYRRPSIDEAYEKSQDWASMGMQNPAWGSYRGDGFWYQQLNNSINEPQFPVWKLVVDDSKIVENVDDPVRGLHNVLGYELYNFCAMVSLGGLQFDIDDILDQLHLKYSRLARGRLRSPLLVHGLRSKSIAIAYRVNEFLGSVDREKVGKLYDGRFSQAKFTYRSQIRENQGFGVGERSRLRKAIASCRRKSDLLNKHTEIGYGIAYGLIMFIVSVLNIFLVVYGIYVTYQLAN